MTLEELQQSVDRDLKIDDTELDTESINIPLLHNKYLQHYNKFSLLLKKSEYEYRVLKRQKWEYYTGKMSKEELDEYGWTPFQFTLKSDITTYLEADGDLIKLLEKKVYHEETVSVIESIMNELKQRTWQLSDFISWEKFIGGQ